MSDIADIESGWRRTSALGVLARGLSYLKSSAIPFAALIYSSRNMGDGWTVALVVVLAGIGLNFALAWLGWRHLRYRIGEEDIRVEKGLLARHARSVPFERIQDVSLEEALVPRLLGLVEARFETGAGGKDEIRLAYVGKAEGEALRETVKARKAEEGAGAPAAEGEAEPASRLLFAMGPRRLLTFGLFEFSLVIFAVLAGAAQQFDFLLPFDIWDPENWPRLLAGSDTLLAGLGVAAQVVGVMLALGALALLGLATGLLRTVLRDWGFRLEETPKGLRRRRGLLTRTDVVMPLHRVQALAIATGIIRRYFGWHSLSIVSLARDRGSASHVAVPFGTLPEIARVADATGFALPRADSEWRRPSAAHRRHAALLGALPPLLAAGAALLVDGALPPEAPSLALPAGGLILLAALLAVRQLFLWRYDRHALDAAHLHVRRGWLAPRLDIAARPKLHSVEIAQGPLARRGDYADLKLGIAGGTMIVTGIPLAEARRLRGELLRSMAAVDFSQLPAAAPAPVPEREGRGEAVTPDQYMMP